jgi:hypothetical protein
VPRVLEMLDAGRWNVSERCREVIAGDGLARKTADTSKKVVSYTGSYTCTENMAKYADFSVCYSTTCRTQKGIGLAHTARQNRYKSTD